MNKPTFGKRSCSKRGEMTIAEAVDFLQNHKITCEDRDVRKWVTEGTIEATIEEEDYFIQEKALVSFLIDLSHQGTAEEKGISLETKIFRLEQKVEELEDELEKLRLEKMKLELTLGIHPF